MPRGRCTMIFPPGRIPLSGAIGKSRFWGVRHPSCSAAGSQISSVRYLSCTTPSQFGANSKQTTCNPMFSFPKGILTVTILSPWYLHHSPWFPPPTVFAYPRSVYAPSPLEGDKRNRMRPEENLRKNPSTSWSSAAWQLISHAQFQRSAELPFPWTPQLPAKCTQPLAA